MKPVPRLAVEICSTLLLFGISLPIGALSLGLFDKTQPPKVTTSVTVTDRLPSLVTTAPTTTAPKPSDVYVPDQKTEVGTEYVTNLRYALGYKSIAGLIVDRAATACSVRVANYNTLISPIDKYVAGESGNIISSDVYDAEKHKILAGEVYNIDYSSGTEIVNKYSKQYGDLDASYITISTPTTIEKKSLQPYMGYLIFYSEDGKKAKLCDMFGATVIEDLGNVAPYYARDMKNRPVFSDGDKYYIVKDGALSEIEKGDIRSELFYDYPAKETAPKGLEAKFDPESGYMRFQTVKSGKWKTALYYKAYNYSENVAVVMLPEANRMRVVNSNGRVQFVPRGWYHWETEVVGQGHSVGDEYTLPDTFGIESIGSTGYDNGYLRVRVVTTSHVVANRTVSDIDILMSKSGKKRNPPDGYTLEGYSNGVMLLSKDGKYGFYTIDDEWIAQPMFTYATPFIQGLAVVGLEDGTLGMIDTDGNIVLPFVFTSLSQVSSGVIVGYCEGIGYQTFYLTENTQTSAN